MSSIFAPHRRRTRMDEFDVRTLRFPAVARALGRRVRSRLAPNTAYWTKYNVTLHRRFKDRDESIAFLDWRNSQYLFYEDLLPYEELKGLTVVDHGCGPGHDLVAITERAEPAELIGFDISSSSVDEAIARLQLHGVPKPDVRLLDEQEVTLPLASESVDFVLSSGVLHHIPEVEPVLAELWRVLRPGGRGRIMVYNYDSLFNHLYVPYTRQIVEGVDRDLDLAAAFQRTTDGPDCPYSIAYRPDAFVALAQRCGFEAECLGAAISALEMLVLPSRFEAVRDERLAAEHRHFLVTLTFDPYGRPLHDGRVAGVDGLFEVRKPDR